MHLEQNPKIEQIRLGGKVYDIDVKKDWAQNDETDINFIKNRTHYVYEAKGSDLYKNGATDYNTAHEFANGYLLLAGSSNKYQCNFTDYWIPPVSWLAVGKKYNFQIQDAKNAESIIIENFNLAPTDPDLNEITIYPGENEPNKPSWKFVYHIDKKAFSVTGEAINTTERRTSFFRVSISVCNDSTTYELTQLLDPKYIPIDYETITIDDKGKLKADSIYSQDFIVTETFGKYKVINGTPVIVPAKGKNIQEVLQDAYCTDVHNSKPLAPSATLKVSLDKPKTVEIGTSVRCIASLTFDKGNYDYPMLDTHNSNAVTDLKSNLEATEYKFLFTGAASANATFNGDEKPEYSTSEIKLDEAKEYTFAVKGTIDYKADPQYENPRYIPGTMLGKEDVVVQRNTEGTIPISGSSTITSQYRYFIVYNKPDKTLTYNTVYNNGNFDRELSEVLTEYKLNEFVPELTTTKLQQIYFLAPKGKVKEIALINATTTASAGTMSGPEAIMVEDAGKKLREYDLFYINNADADSGTNKYKVEVTK